MSRDNEDVEERFLELEREIDRQKERFLRSAQGGVDAMKKDLSILNWVKAYPRETAIGIMVAGFMAARVIRARRSGVSGRYGAPLEMG